MNPTTARTLLVLAASLLVAGGTVGAPEASVALAGLAALLSLPAAISRPGVLRTVATVVLAASAMLAIARYPEAKRSMADYRARAAGRGAAPRLR